MAVNRATLAFVHRLVTNFYKNGYYDHARKSLERFGGATFLQEASEANLDSEAKNMLANLSFVWWRVTQDVSAHDRALAIWTRLQGGENGVHAAMMLGYMAIMAPDNTTNHQIFERIARLRAAQKETQDVESVSRITELARRLSELFLRRCGK